MSSYAPPTTLSPSRIDSFLSCPLAFRFSSLDGLFDPPTQATVRGTMVHRALEHFYADTAAPLDAERMNDSVDQMLNEFEHDDDVLFLGLEGVRFIQLGDECRKLAMNALRMEDPSMVNPIGLELRIEAEFNGVTLRGIIDRLERDNDDRLVITDYKTGRAPGPSFEKKALAGVHFYALLCQREFAEDATELRLMYVKSSQTLTTRPSSKTISFTEQRLTAVHRAISQACESGEFATRKSALCKFCTFSSWCPEFGGDPQLALVEAPRRNPTSPE